MRAKEYLVKRLPGRRPVGLLLAGCGGPPPAPASGPVQGEDTVVVAMDPNSEPAAGFDPAFGWGAGEHVHEPLIQSTLTVTNPTSPSAMTWPPGTPSATTASPGR